MARQKKEMKSPKTVELRIRLLHEMKPDKDGFWRFVPVLPNEGTCDMRIVAKTPRKAKDLLEQWLSNWMQQELRDEEAMQHG